MALPSFTEVFRKDTYDAIDPNRPELSSKDKTVIVTGAGAGGIGAQVALSFATAGAAKIGLIGRTEKTLQATRELIITAYPETNVFVTVADVSKAESVGLAAHEIRVALGAWDVFANFAAVFPKSTTIAGADEDDWWQPFEVSVKFSHHFAKHFLPKARPNATFINCNAGAALVPATRMPRISAYSAAKVAAGKLDEYLAAENPALRVFTIHPGVVDTAMYQKAVGAKEDQKVPATTMLDTVALPAHFTVWLAGPESEFLRGRYLWVNWDVKELVARKQEIEANQTLLTISLGGWPFQ